VYGIDMPSAEELIAHDRSEEDVGKMIGADRLIYQNIDDLIDAARRGNPDITVFDSSCFTGRYVTGDVSQDYLERIAALRSDDAKLDRSGGIDTLTDLNAVVG